MSPVVRPISKRAEKKLGYTIKPVNPSPGNTGSAEENSSVADESTPLEDPKTGERDRACGYYKMDVLGKIDAEHVNKFIKKNAGGDIVLFTDKTRPI